MLSVKHRFIETNGIRMHIAERGAGPLVILCHGWPELWYSWRHQIRTLAEAGFRVVAPDMRGFGETDAPEAIEDYHQLLLTGDIVGLVHALGETEATIAGHDWGASVAWHCALFRPDIFRRLVLLSVPYVPRGRNAGSRLATLRQIGDDTQEFYMIYFQEPGRAEAELEADVRRTFTVIMNGYGGRKDAKVLPMVNTRLGLLGTFGDRTRADWFSAEDLDVYTKTYERTGFRGGLNYYRNLDRSSALTAPWAGARIMQPSLFIAGEYDTVVQSMYPSEYANLEKTMPGLTRKVLIPGAGHWVQQERPEEVSRLMLDFLRRPFLS